MFQNFKRLILLRHADALDLVKDGDWSRPLSSKGKIQARQIAIKLRELSWGPDLALISDSVRTAQTWEIFETALEGPVPHFFRKELYLPLNDDILKILRDESPKLNETQNTLLVLGHNPVLEDLANDLLKEDRKIRLSKASAVCLVSNEHSWNLAFSQKGIWTMKHALEVSGK